MCACYLLCTLQPFLQFLMHRSWHDLASIMMFICFLSEFSILNPVYPWKLFLVLLVKIKRTCMPQKWHTRLIEGDKKSLDLNVSLRHWIPNENPSTAKIPVNSIDHDCFLRYTCIMDKYAFHDRYNGPIRNCWCTDRQHFFFNPMRQLTNQGW